MGIWYPIEETTITDKCARRYREIEPGSGLPPSSRQRLSPSRVCGGFAQNHIDQAFLSVERYFSRSPSHEKRWTFATSSVDNLTIRILTIGPSSIKVALSTIRPPAPYLDFQCSMSRLSVLHPGLEMRLAVQFSRKSSYNNSRKR